MDIDDTFFETHIVPNIEKVTVDKSCIEYLISNCEFYNGDTFLLGNDLVPISTIPDGNCFLNSVSIAVCGKDEHCRTLRNMLSTELIENLGFYQKICLEIQGFEWDLIAEDAQKNGESLGMVHIFILANAIRRPIILISSEECRGSNDGEKSTATFLPTRREPIDCIKRPIIISWNSHLRYHCVPIVPVNITDFVFDVPKVAYIESLISSYKLEDYLNLTEPIIPSCKFVKNFENIHCNIVIKNYEEKETLLEFDLAPFKFHGINDIIDKYIEVESISQEDKQIIYYNLNGYNYKYNQFVATEDLKKKMIFNILETNAKYKGRSSLLTEDEIVILKEFLYNLASYDTHRHIINSFLDKMQRWDEEDLFKTIDALSVIISKHLMDNFQDKLDWICSLVCTSDQFHLTVTSLRFFLNMFKKMPYVNILFDTTFFNALLRLLQKFNSRKTFSFNQKRILLEKYIPQLFQNVILLYKTNNVQFANDVLKECIHEYSNIITDDSFIEYPENVQKCVIVALDRMCYEVEITNLSKEVKRKLYELYLSSNEEIGFAVSVLLQYHYLKKREENRVQFLKSVLGLQ